MQNTSTYLALVALGAAMTFAACAGSPDASPVASSPAGSGDTAAFTSSGYGPGAPASPPGTGADPADIAAMLGAAIQEEYGAENLYRSVLEDYAGAMPFATIAEAEDQHVQALARLFARRQMTPPPSATTPASFPPYASLALACGAGVDAERRDAEFYAPYLGRTDLPQDIRNVFTHLQAASLENHLPAFQACANQGTVD
jgi:hypothetical protein